MATFRGCIHLQKKLQNWIVLPINFLIVYNKVTFGIYFAEPKKFVYFQFPPLCIFKVYIERERMVVLIKQYELNIVIWELDSSRHTPSALYPNTYWFGLYIKSNLPTCSIFIFFFSMKKLTILILVVKYFGLNAIYFLNAWRNL